MTTLSAPDDNDLIEFLKLYKWTSIYTAFVITLILIVFVVSELLGG